MHINQPLSNRGNYDAHGPSDTHHANESQHAAPELKSRWSLDTEDIGYRNAAYLKLKSSFSFKELKPMMAKARTLFPSTEKKVKTPPDVTTAKTENSAQKLMRPGRHPLENPGKPPHPRLGRISQPYNPRHVATAFENPRPAPFPPGQHPAELQAFEHPRRAPLPPGQHQLPELSGQNAQAWADETISAIYGRK